MLPSALSVLPVRSSVAVSPPVSRQSAFGSPSTLPLPSTVPSLVRTASSARPSPS